MGKSVRVTNGHEVLEIDSADLNDAVRDGYRPTERVIVANPKTRETFEIAPEDYQHALKDGFNFSSVVTPKKTEKPTPFVSNVDFSNPFKLVAPNYEQEQAIHHQVQVAQAKDRIQQLLANKSDAAIKSVLHQAKSQVQMARFQDDLKTRGIDLPSSKIDLSRVQQLMPQAAVNVSDKEIQEYKKNMLNNPHDARVVLNEYAKLHPTESRQVASDIYMWDSEDRAAGANTQQILKNKEGIEKGENEYDIIRGGKVQKPIGFIPSLVKGFKERQQQFSDYKLLHNGTDEDIIKEQESRRNAPRNIDEPEPTPSGFGGGAGHLAGSEGITIGKGALPAILDVATGGGATPAVPWLSALLTSPDFYERGYANSFNQNYNELRDAGKSPEEALQIARNRARFDASTDVAVGAAMSATATNLKPFASVTRKFTPGFLGAVKSAARDMAATSPDAAAVGLLGGVGQVAKNIHSDKKIDEGVAEAALTPIAFHYGIKTIASTLKVTSSIYKSAVENMARQPEQDVNKAIGEGVESGDLSPQKATEVYNVVNEKRQQNEELINKAKEIVAKGKIQGVSAVPLQDAALNNPEQFADHLKSIAEQAHDPKTAEHTAEVFGEDLLNVAKQLYPHEDVPALIESNRKHDIQEVDDEIKKLTPESKDYAVKKRALEEQKKVINDYYDNHAKAHEANNAPGKEPETVAPAESAPEDKQPIPLSNQQIDAAKGFLRQGIDNGTIDKEYEPFIEHADHFLDHIRDEVKAGKKAEMEKEFGNDLVTLSQQEAHYPVVRNIKPKENAIPIESPNEMDVRQQAGDGGTLGEGNTNPEEPTGTQAQAEGENKGKESEVDPIYELPFEMGPEDRRTGIKNQISNTIRFEMKLPRVEVPKLGTDTEVLAQGKELVDSGKINPHEVVDRVLSAPEGMHGMQPDEEKAMQYYMHQLGAHEQVLRQQLSDAPDELARAYTKQQMQQLSDEIDAATEANMKGGNAWGHSGNIRQIVVDPGFNASRERSLIKESYGGKLPPGVQERIDAALKQRDAAIEARLKAEERLKNAAANKTVEKIKKVVEKEENAPKSKKLTKEDILKEREGLIEDLKKAWKQDRSQLGAFPLPAQTVAAIGRLAINYFKEGYVNLEELTEKIFEDVKAHIPGVGKKDIRDAISQFDPLRDVAKDISQQKLEAKEQRINKQLASGKLIPPKTNPSLNFEKDTAWQQAKQKAINAEYKLKVEKRKAFESKKNMYQKGLMWLGRGVRLSVLSGYNVLGKLASAATIGGAGKRIPEQAIGTMWSKMFKGISEKATIEGSPNLSAELKFYKEFFNPKKFAKNSWEILKSGSSPLSKQFGGAEHEHIPVLYLPTDLHQIIKDPLKRATFEASFKNAMSWANKQGLDITDPLVIQSMETAAYKRAQYEIFQEQNWLSKKFSEFKTGMEKKGNIGATGKFIADFMIPVSTVPTNIARRLTTTSPLGLLRGTAQALYAYRQGLENLSNEQADAIMRQLKQGSLGTALWLTGWYFSSQFGGLYSRFNPDKKRKEGEFTSDEMAVGGKMIPKPVQHALPLEIMQLAATMKHIHDNYTGNLGKGEFEADLNAALGSIGALAEQLPAIEEPIHMIGATQNPYEAKKLKEDVQRRFEPQILRETGVIKKAEKTPTSSGTRKVAKGGKRNHKK